MQKYDPSELIIEVNDHTTDLRAQNLSRAQLSDMNLERVDFRDCEMGAVWFYRSALASAQFSGSRIRLTKFCDADLRGAGFEGAFIKGVDFSGCNLESADFTGATLEYVNFTNANLSNACFRDAAFTPTSLLGTRLDDIDLSNATLDLSKSGVQGSGKNDYIKFGHFDGGIVSYTSDRVRISLPRSRVFLNSTVAQLANYSAEYRQGASQGKNAFAVWWETNGSSVLEYISARPALTTGVSAPVQTENPPGTSMLSVIHARAINEKEGDLKGSASQPPAGSAMLRNT